MLDIQQKRKLRSFLYHKFVLAFLFVLTILFLHSTWVVYHKKVSSDEMKSLAKNKVLELTTRKKDLDSKIGRLATVSGVEEEIRSKFSVTKDDEKMVVVVPDNEVNASTTSKSVSFWSKIVDFFK